jgi:hypothetical protein
LPRAPGAWPGHPTLGPTHFSDAWLGRCGVSCCGRSYLLLPNHSLGPSFGKCVFAALDLVVGLQLLRLLTAPAAVDSPAFAAITPVGEGGSSRSRSHSSSRSRSRSRSRGRSRSRSHSHSRSRSHGRRFSGPSDAGAAACKVERVPPDRALAWVAWFLLNPLTVAISSRGSHDAVVMCFVLGFVGAYHRRSFLVAGVWCVGVSLAGGCRRQSCPPV